MKGAPGCNANLNRGSSINQLCDSGQGIDIISSSVPNFRVTGRIQVEFCFVRKARIKVQKSKVHK